MAKTPPSPLARAVPPVLFALALLFVVILALEATSIYGDCGIIRYSVDLGDGGEVHLRQGSGRCRLSVDMEGEVVFSDDEREVARLGRRASLEIETRQEGVRRRIEVTPGPGGEPRYAYWVDREPRELDAEGREWLAETIPLVLRLSGFDVEGRVARFLERGGPDAVLDEAEQISSDHVQRLYLEQLFAAFEKGTTGLDAAERRRALELAGEGIGSDYELAELLLAVVRAHPAGEPLPPSFAGALESIGSDYEMRRALAAAFAHPGLDDGALDDLCRAGRGIGSDYELAEAMIVLAGSWSGAPPASCFETLETIGSDYEMRRALTAFVDRADLDDRSARALLETAKAIGSDYELAELLIAFAGGRGLAPEVEAAFRSALETVGSRHERERVEKARGEGGGA